MTQLKCFSCGDIVEDKQTKTIIASGMRKAVCLKCFDSSKSNISPGQNPIVSPQPEKQSALGWLVVHDENTHQQIFDLKPGANSIGRLSAKSVDISIETNDLAMSRHHCTINIERSKLGNYIFMLQDNQSTNGTFVNGALNKRLHELDIVVLKEGDSIQLGETKLVLKVNKGITNKETIVRQVEESPYEPTVIVRRK